MSQRPVVVGLFLCENVIVEEGTHNITLVNCFSIRAAERFPSEPLSFLLFATMTDGLGEMTFDVMIERLADLQEVYRRSSVVRLVDRLQEVRFKLQIAGCSFPSPGAYLVSLLADGELIGQRRFLVV